MRSRAIVSFVALLTLSACDNQQVRTVSQYKSSETPAEPTQSDQQKGEALLAPLLKEPGATWAATLKELYPQDYAEVAKRMGEIVDSDTSIPKARVQFASYVAPVLQEKKRIALGASDNALVKVLRLNAAVNDQLLVEDVKACNSAPKGLLEPTIELSDKAWGAMSDATKAMLEAAHAAEQASATPTPPPQLTPQDFAEWRAAMVQVGATDETFAKITDPALKAAMSPAEKCEIRGVMYRAALVLPSSLTAKLARTLLASGVSPRP